MGKMNERTFRVYLQGEYEGTYDGTDELHALTEYARDQGFHDLDDMIGRTGHDRDDFQTRRPSDLLNLQ